MPKLTERQQQELREARLHQALWLVSLGYWVFPVRADSKGDRRSGQSTQLLKSWQQESSNDSGQVERWWQRWPDANIAIDCGKSGILVADPDAPKERINKVTGEVTYSLDGRPAWRGLALQHEWSTDPDVITPRGGWHFYFRNPTGLGNKTGDLPEGIDIRGVGGYVLAPGSAIGGRIYAGELPR